LSSRVPPQQIIEHADNPPAPPFKVEASVAGGAATFVAAPDPCRPVANPAETLLALPVTVLA
jgi:hypothetical protein